MVKYINSGDGNGGGGNINNNESTNAFVEYLSHFY
jgi:hypothetical protein